MKNTKFLWFIILILLGLSGFLVKKFIIGGSNVEVSDDGRLAVVMTKDERDFVLKEMRAFLVSVQGVSAAITQNDLPKVAELATKAGMAAEANTPTALLAKIPLSMKKLGFGTRRLFDDIATTATTDKDAAKLRDQLDALMLNCIACHAIYRLPEPK